MRTRRWLILLAAIAVPACSDDGGSGSSGSEQAPGRSDQGWQKAYLDGGAGLSCDTSLPEALDAQAPHIQVGETTLVVGFEQVGDNQNPLVMRFDADRQVYCRRHETEGPDGRAVGITWDGAETAYVTYTVVGGGSSLEGRGGWLDAYAPGAIHGGGPKVAYLGRVDVTDGALESGSFIIAVKSDNSVNTHRPAGAPTVLDDGTVEFVGESAHKPVDPNGRESMDCTDYPFESRYVFEADLGALVCAECTNCTSSKPCGSP